MPSYLHLATSNRTPILTMKQQEGHDRELMVGLGEGNDELEGQSEGLAMA